jgi:hypothetical protein
VPAERVPAIIPLSLLEAMRNLDAPVEDGLSEVAAEIVAKRLGLSATVAAQIQRYSEAMRRNQLLPAEEVVSVFRLVDRRPDASLVFADAGRRAARHAVRTATIAVRTLVHSTPGFLGRRVGFRVARRVAWRIFRARLHMTGSRAEAEVAEPIGELLGGASRSCMFYGAAFAELLRLQTGFEGAMIHRGCRLDGSPRCHWEALHVGDDE